eukprot:5997192-Amphidinium_carterae.1
MAIASMGARLPTITKMPLHVQELLGLFSEPASVPFLRRIMRKLHKTRGAQVTLQHQSSKLTLDSSLRKIERGHGDLGGVGVESNVTTSNCRL